MNESIEPVAGTSQESRVGNESDFPVASFSKSSVDVGIQAHLRDPRTSVLKRKNKVLLQQNRRLKLQVLSLTSNVKRLVAITRRLRKRAKVSARREEIANLPPHVQTFIDEQSKLINKSGRGFKWSNSTVMMGQFLLYKSPSCYRRLQQFFAMPSSRTLIRRSPSTSKTVSTFLTLRFYLL